VGCHGQPTPRRSTDHPIPRPLPDRRRALGHGVEPGRVGSLLKEAVGGLAVAVVGLRLADPGRPDEACHERIRRPAGPAVVGVFAPHALGEEPGGVRGVDLVEHPEGERDGVRHLGIDHLADGRRLPPAKASNHHARGDRLVAGRRYPTGCRRSRRPPGRGCARRPAPSFPHHVSPNSATSRLLPSRRHLIQRQLKLDLDVFRHDQPAGFGQVIPLQVVVEPVDGRVGGVRCDRALRTIRGEKRPGTNGTGGAETHGDAMALKRPRRRRRTGCRAGARVRPIGCDSP